MSDQNDSRPMIRAKGKKIGVVGTEYGEFDVYEYSGRVYTITPENLLLLGYPERMSSNSLGLGANPLQTAGKQVEQGITAMLQKKDDVNAPWVQQMLSFTKTQTAETATTKEDIAKIKTALINLSKALE